MLARNSVVNLLGQLAPLVAALLAIPLLLAGIGTARFGLLALAWMAIGYFSLFDLGLGRALTQLVAKKIGEGREDEVPALVWTSQLLMLLFGLAGGVVLFLAAPWLVRQGLNVPAALQQEALSAFRLLALGLPFVIGAAGFRGLLEARQQFGLVNAVRVPIGVASFLGPVAVLPFSSSLVPIVAILAASRMVAWIAYLALCTRAVPQMRREVRFARETLRPLLGFGGWMTVTNVVSPIMVYFDRFLIGAVLSVSAVAYYATPYEIVAKLWLVPGSLLAVFFPAFAAAHASAPARLGTLFDSAVRVLVLLLFPVAVVLVMFAEEGLTLWVGGDFAAVSAPVLKWLAVGVFVNSIGQVPFTVVQSIGRPDLTAKLHLMELPLYLVLIWTFTARWGIEGAAVAWVTRASVDALVLFLIAGRITPESTVALRRAAALMVPAVAVLGVGAALRGMPVKVGFLAVVAAGFGLLAWRRLLRADERVIVRATAAAVAARTRPWLLRERRAS
jgi:O-antigen/teichoic acid export membrane protein